jgi:iron complex outermembrane receptor protein
MLDGNPVRQTGVPAAIVAALVAAQGQAVAQTPRIPFDIEGQQLASALHEFARQSDRQILFSNDVVQTRRTRGVKGELSPDTALAELLKDTGLKYRETSDGTILIENAAAPIRVTQANGPVPELTPPAATTPQPSLEEVIVTGTFLRGITPPGSQPLSIGREDIVATGAATTAQLLANLPQIGDFNTKPIYNGFFNTQNSVNHPDLRNLGALLLGGGSPTLLLLDGHRLPGMGVRQTVPDSDVIPPGAIERVEVLTDGGSSIYGTDAVGGVVNYIVRRRFDGVELNGRYGFADNYQSTDVGATIGKDWGRGSIFATYSFNWHDKIFGRDRDFVERRDYILDLPLDLTCEPGNVIIGSAVYALPDLTRGIGNRCDIYDDASVYPDERRHSAFVGFTQALTDRIELNVHGYYTHRVNLTEGGPISGTVRIPPSSPFYRDTGDENSGRTQTVALNWSSVLPETPQRGELNTWGITPSITVEMEKNWELRVLANYGHGTNKVNTQLIDTSRFAALVGAGAINPYNLADPVNAAALAPIINWSNDGKGEHELINGRAIIEGAPFGLPGGDVRLAIGAEYIHEKYDVQAGVGPKDDFSTRPRGGASRDVYAGFAELFIPLFGADNRQTGLHSLAFSASGRYDDYEDFGDTFNPRLALTYEPVEWLRLRGNWGKSFQAPSLADGAGATVNTITVLPRVVIPIPGIPPAPGQAQIFLSGGGVNLKPQKAETQSFGVDIEAPFYDGLSASLTYYKIKFKDLIAVPPVTNANIFYDLYPDYYIYNPTIEQILQFASSAPNGLNAVAPYVTEPGQVYVMADGRRANFSTIHTSGLDFSLRLDVPMSFGSVFARWNGNYVLKRDEQTRTGAPFVSTRDNFTRLRWAATAGAVVGKFRGQATWQRSGGYDVIPTPASLNQDRVNAFNVVNLFFQYDFVGRSGMRDGLALTLNVDNVFNQDPPIYRGASGGGIGGGYANGFTLGRLFQLGLSKKF